MNKVKKQSELKDGEHYVVFVGYDYSPSGFDVATYNSKDGTFTTQANDQDFAYYELKFIYTLPPIEI
jgi:hypothetical protein